MLFATHTSISVPALTGAIMCMGVATANSILVVSFARERLNAGEPRGPGRAERRNHALPSRADDGPGDDRRHGADGAGPGRRAASRMQPLGRAVIGGLLFATMATLLFVSLRVRDDPRPPGTRHGPLDPPEFAMPEPGSNQLNPARPGSRKIAMVGAVVVCVGLFAWTIVSRGMARKRAARPDDRDGRPDGRNHQNRGRGPADEELVLPGTVQAYNEAPIYARTSGYLKIWYTDIGARRSGRGQVSGRDRYARSRPAAQTGRGGLGLPRRPITSWHRAPMSAGRVCWATESVSKQDADQKASDETAKKAAVASAGANVARLHDLESFKRVVAPFDGVVTARNTDIGALINAGQNSGARAVSGWPTPANCASTHRCHSRTRRPRCRASWPS